MKLYRLIIGLILTMLFINVAASAAIEGDSKSVAAAHNAKNSTDEKPTDTSTTSKPSLETEIILLNEKMKKMEEMVERQQRTIERQQQLIEAMQPKMVETNSSLPATAPINNTNDSATTTAQTSPAPAAEDLNKKLDTLYKAFGQMTLSGDFRFRYDGIFHQGFDGAQELPVRNRIRPRARLQLAGQFQKNFDWAIRLATGSFTNPDSTSQTATDFFNRKPVGFDRFFIRYDTKTEGAGLTLQGGKFDFPWKRTELTFDNDIQPEGAAETFYYKGKNALKDIRLVAFQLPFNEVAAGKDSAIFGGQLQSTVGSGDWTVTGAVTYLNFNQVDALARALGRPSTQVGGGLELTTTNRVRRDTAGNIIGFAANYNLLDIIGEVKYNGFKKFPIALTLDYVRNMSDRLERLKERNGYWAELHIGRIKEKGDIEFSYTFDRVEQDAVVSAFSFDDFLATNSRNNRVTFAYTVNSNVWVQFIGLFSERFNTLPKSDNRIQRRFQFDVNYRF